MARKIDQDERLTERLEKFEKITTAAATALRAGRKEFKCPFCPGTAMVIKSTYNHHLWVSCDGCGLSVME